MSYSTDLEDLIDHTLIDNEELYKQRIIGGVGYLLNGNMCFGIYEDLLVLRTTKNNVEELLKKPGFRPFDVDKQSRDDFVMIKPRIYKNRKKLKFLLMESIRYTKTLPPQNDEEIII